MRILMTALLIAVVFAFMGTAMATAPGKTLDYPGGAMGKVTFDGKTHADAGGKCMDCHPALFGEMKPDGVTNIKITMDDHVPGKYCGVCHDGTKAFDQKPDCAKCHKK